MKNPPSRLPIAIAKRIVDDHQQRQVIVVTWDGETTHVVTFGKSVEDCAQAAIGGNMVKKALGWPNELCQAQPARGRKKTGTQGDRVKALKNRTQKDVFGNNVISEIA